MRVTTGILIVCVAVYLFGNPQALWLWPVASAEHRWWQPLTYAFVHGSPVHLMLNMLALLSFGPSLERSWGKWRFLAAYLLCAAVAGILQADLAHAPTVGASGALFGLFAAWTMATPHRKLTFPPLPAWLVLALYGVFTALAWIFGWLPGVAHAVHAGGAVMGLLCAGYYRAVRSR